VGDHLPDLLHDLERTYTVVIVDTPPAVLVPDASLILQHVSAWLAVARCGRTRQRAFRQMVGLLPSDRLLGGVLNEGPLATRARHYGYYGDDADE
jgi:Mrp family chromosome partitioning ATPase